VTTIEQVTITNVTNMPRDEIEKRILGIQNPGTGTAPLGQIMSDQQRMEEEKKKETEIQIEREKRKIEEERRMREAQIDSEKKKIEEERRVHLMQAEEQGTIL